MNYGETARLNGDKFECIMKNFYNNNPKDICERINIECNGKFHVYNNKKVKSIHTKLTTRKADIFYETESQKITFSVKMTNNGSQLQIISLANFIKCVEYYNHVKMDTETKIAFEKFLGLQSPTDQELEDFKRKRSKRNKNKKRFWMNELPKNEQKNILDYIKKNYDTIMEIIFKYGCCLEDENKAEYFIFNDTYYTKTGEIKPKIFTWEELYNFFIPDVKITKHGSLQLNKYIGIQMKGSGKGSSYHCIQFKLRKMKYNNIKEKNNNTKKMKNEKLIGLSLFSSSGIGETYIDKFVDMKVANELLIDRSKLYKYLYPNVNMIQGSITDEKTYLDIKNAAKKHNINFIYATPPCQSFSKAGKQKIGDKRDSLFSNIISLAIELNPEYIFIENVPEFVKLDIIYEGKKTKVIDVLDKELGNKWNINYDIVNASNYGTHQNRKRSIILLSRKDKKEWLIPKQITNSQDMTVKKAIGNLESLESGEKSTEHQYHYAKKHNDRHISWMKHTPTGKTAFNNVKYYPQKDGRKIKGFKTTYKRMCWDKPAPTITIANGSISSQNNVHPGRSLENGIYSDARVLTIYELILLSGLPKDWLKDRPKWVSDNLIRQVFGECVPPKLVLNMLENINKEETFVEKEDNYTNLTVKQLKALCKTKKIKKYSKLKKDELIDLLLKNK